MGWRAITRSLARTKPDLCVLSEIRTEAMPAVAEGLGDPPYHMRMKSSLAVLTRDTLGHPRRLPVRNTPLTAFLVEVQLSGHPLLLMAVDMPSDLQYAREPRLEELVELIRTYQPDLVLGDFNAPRRSNALAKLPQGYRHAYDAVGRGWSYTWPVPMPLYALDQCILGPRIEPIRYDLQSSLFSDHRRQVLDISITPFAIDHMQNER
jgi:endonuclease/exonuclease/phosphatase (EEP) superfamily protein YafD